jgi:hypothetical protein
LFTGQALSWFVPLFKRGVHVLNNFEVFLAGFVEVFEDHDKACSATTKIYVQRQRSCLVFVYVSTSDYWHAILIEKKRRL